MSLALILSIASVATAIIALGVSLHHQFLRAPKVTLALDINRTLGDLITLPPTVPGDEGVRLRVRDASEHWVRLRVMNARGKRSAESVEVLYIGRRSDGEMNLNPRHLRFSSTSENKEHTDILAMGASKPELAVTVAPGVFRQVDFIAASMSRVVADHHRGRPRLAVWPGPGEVLEPGSHEIFLAVTATDTDAAFYRLSVDVSEGWADRPDIWWTEHLVLSKFDRIRTDEVPGRPPGA